MQILMLTIFLITTKLRCSSSYSPEDLFLVSNYSSSSIFLTYSNETELRFLEANSSKNHSTYSMHSMTSAKNLTEGYKYSLRSMLFIISQLSHEDSKNTVRNSPVTNDS